MKIIIPKNIPFRILGEIGVNYLRRNSANRQESALHLQETLLSYISHDCVDVIDKYRNISIDNEFKQKKIDRIIWVLWWQGDVDSNPIVSVCINKLYKIKGFDHELDETFVSWVISQFNFLSKLSVLEKLDYAEVKEWFNVFISNEWLINFMTTQEISNFNDRVSRMIIKTKSPVIVYLFVKALSVAIKFE